MTHYSLTQRLVAEALGTCALVATVVGSGIMAEQLASGNSAIALLGNTLATGAMLIVLIIALGPISGAHFNPAVSLAFCLRKQLSVPLLLVYTLVQICGGILGTVVAHAMFELPPLMNATIARTGASQWFAEFVATFGLVSTILATLATRSSAVPYTVGLYISAGYWFTASTSFANPAVTISRGFTDTFSGIQILHAPGFIAAQLLGAGVAVILMGWLFKHQGN